MMSWGSLNAQIQTPVIKKIISTPPPPPTYTPIYSLTSVKVSIKTGNDNKEFPSGLYIDLWQKGYPGAYYREYCLFKIHDYKNELPSNSNTQIGLEKYDGPVEKHLLTTIQQKGLELTVYYLPNFFLDAWRVESIICTFEFKDQNGNLHPTLGNKVIIFPNSKGFLNNDYHSFKCIIDQNLNGLSASIVK